MSKIYKAFIRPAMFALSAEAAHEFGIAALRLGLVRVAAAEVRPGFANLERLGLRLSSPLGVAAGFDKNGLVVNQLADLGFGFVEVGTITYESQPGNERPRVFRLPNEEALINRLGFNNEGARKIVKRLKKISPRCVLGINIGRNKNVSVEDTTENYLKSFDLAHQVADYIAVNVSSPNTPGLRRLQKGDELEKLLGSLQKRNHELGTKPLLVKIAPDLSEAEIEIIVNICLENGVHGIIATNTTVARTGLATPGVEIAKIGTGGLSGRPLTKRSTEVVSSVHGFSKGRLLIIGVGGIFTPEDAFEKIAAGASLIQAYTGFIYQGPTFARDINEGLERMLRERGFANLDEAVGSAGA